MRDCSSDSIPLGEDLGKRGLTDEEDWEMFGLRGKGKVGTIFQ